MSDLARPFRIGSKEFKHRLIQGPLAGYSCSAMRSGFSKYLNPAYAVSEMLSALEIAQAKHSATGRYLHKHASEDKLCYQLAGQQASIMAEAAEYLQNLAADLIDINAACPKQKIRKKGAGSALLEQEDKLLNIIQAVKKGLHIPLTVKIRLQTAQQDLDLASKIEQAGADALIVHGRRWQDDYTVPVDYQGIARIKNKISIPVIANGDIRCHHSLKRIFEETGCDAYMISRAGFAKPYIFYDLLYATELRQLSAHERLNEMMSHVQQLMDLEHEYKALLQARSLCKYYFPEHYSAAFLSEVCQCRTLADLHELFLQRI